MKKQSAGILPYRRKGGIVEVFLVHPGGPFWAGKDAAAWSIPKGTCNENEAPLDAARREFTEETGFVASEHLLFLGAIRQPGGKIVHAWSMEADLDAGSFKSDEFQLEWPPHSGHVKSFPEVDKASWFDCEAARTKLHKGLVPLIDLLLAKMK